MAMNDTKTSGKSTRSAKVTLTKNADDTTTVQKGGEFAGKLPSTRAKKAPVVKSTTKKVVDVKRTTPVIKSYIDQFTRDAAIAVAGASSDPNVLELLARHPSLKQEETEGTPATKWKPASKDSNHFGLKCTIARNPYTPESLLLEWASDKEKLDDVLAGNLASNSKASKELLRTLYRNHNSEEISRHLTRNPNTPPEIIHSIIANGATDTDILIYASENPVTKTETLDMIVGDIDRNWFHRQDALLVVSQHANASDQALATLSDFRYSGLSAYDRRTFDSIHENAVAAIQARTLSRSLEKLRLLKNAGWA